MQQIILGDTEVILQNYDLGKGKIIIADPYEGNYSYFWGSMGESLEKFISTINSDYFANALCKERFVYSGKNTAYNIRQFIKKERSYELPWYKYLTAQKEFRKKLRELENVEDEQEAIAWMETIHEDLDCYDLDYSTEREFREEIKNLFNQEPWHFLGKEPSPSYKFLVSTHKKLKKELWKKLTVPTATQSS